MMGSLEELRDLERKRTALFNMMEKATESVHNLLQDLAPVEVRDLLNAVLGQWYVFDELGRTYVKADYCRDRNGKYGIELKENGAEPIGDNMYKYVLGLYPMELETLLNDIIDYITVKTENCFKGEQVTYIKVDAIRGITLHYGKVAE